MNLSIYLERSSANFLSFTKTHAAHLAIFFMILPFAAATTGFSFAYFQGSKIASFANEYKDLAISPKMIGYTIAFVIAFIGSKALHLLSLSRIINNRVEGKFAGRGERDARFLLFMSFGLNLAAGIAGEGITFESFMSFLGISAFFEIIIYVDCHAMLELDKDEALTYIAIEKTTQHRVLSKQEQNKILEDNDDNGLDTTSYSTPSASGGSPYSDLIA